MIAIKKMGGAGEKPQEDTVYYKKRYLFELNILVCGNYIEDLIRKDLNQINELIGMKYKKRKI